MNTVNPEAKSSSVRIEMRSAVIRDMLPWIEGILSDERVRVKTITEKSGYGHWHFQRVFREQIVYNLAEYIRVRRIARAAHSLAFTDKEFIDIAIENGFTSQQNFSRTFKKYLRLPPMHFRQACCGRDRVFQTFTRELHENYVGVFY